METTGTGCGIMIAQEGRFVKGERRKGDAGQLRRTVENPTVGGMKNREVRMGFGGL